MTENFIKKAYLSLYEFLDNEYYKKSDDALAVLLGSMNPYIFIGGMSADSACYSDFSVLAQRYENDDVKTAYKCSVDFLNMYCNDYKFDIKRHIDFMTFEKYCEAFKNQED